MDSLDSTYELKALDHLISQIPEGKYEQIVSSGRGGAWVAAQVAYALDLPLFIGPTLPYFPNALFIDDIEDTSETIDNSILDSGVLIQKNNSKRHANYVGSVIDTDEYVHFTFQSKEKR